MDNQIQDDSDNLLKLYAGITGKILLLIDGGFQTGLLKTPQTIAGNGWIKIEELLERWNCIFSKQYREITYDELVVILNANNTDWFRRSYYPDGRWRAVCSRCLGGEMNYPD